MLLLFQFCSWRPGTHDTNPASFASMFRDILQSAAKNMLFLGAIS
jgi:hypothetical protein